MKRILSTFFLAAYSALLIKVLVYKDVPNFNIGQLMVNLGGTNGGRPPNFIPFSTIIGYLLNEHGFLVAGVNLLGNVALFVPIGFVIPLVFKNSTWKKSIFIAIVAGLTIEIMQAVTNLGIFDVDDVILNALGVMVGYWAIHFLVKWVHSRKYINIAIAGILALATVVAALYISYPRGDGVVNTAEQLASQGGDPCGTTRGTGQIISIEGDRLTVKRNDDSLLKVELTNNTTFRTSEGMATQADLKTGDSVTLIVDDSETVAAVLVCGTSR